MHSSALGRRRDAAKLEAELRALLGRAPNTVEQRIARGLFGQVLDVPGGMKIQTIHAFCQSLLRRFPIESGLAPHFEVMDDRTAAELMLAARDDLLRATPEGVVGRAWASVTAETDEESFGELMRGLAAKRGTLKRLFAAQGGVTGALKALCKRLGLKDGETTETILAAGVADAALDLPGLRDAAARMALGKKDRPRSIQAISRLCSMTLKAVLLNLRLIVKASSLLARGVHMPIR